MLTSLEEKKNSTPIPPTLCRQVEISHWPKSTYVCLCLVLHIHQPHPSRIMLSDPPMNPANVTPQHVGTTAMSS